MIRLDLHNTQLLPRIERYAVAAIMIGTLVFGASSVRADEDGGGRSVFAFGAGNRALGLGGAYAALANDASAPVWNIGGLGWVTQPELQFTQASYFGVGMNEQFGSLAVPHWRWGVASLTFRRFAVDGIEQRDDRNALIATDLSDSQTEFLLGFARAIGTAWSVGGAVKTRRHDLAGFNDSSVGLDLGVVVKLIKVISPNSRNSERVTVGLSVRNVVQPTLRLMQEKVADPTGVQIGTAVHLAVFGRPLLASLDFEKTSRMDTRLHSGFELAVHPILSLRAGVSDGIFATGTSVQYRGVALDYVFEDNNIDDLHRLGVTFAFGPTVDQRRRAVYDRRENELEAQFDAAFTQRQEVRVVSLLAQADAAMSAGEYDDALELLAVVGALEPGNMVARERQVSCLIGLGSAAEERGDYAVALVSYAQALSLDPANSLANAAHDRTLAESDRMAARSKDIRGRFALAMDAFSEQRLVDARRGFESILAESPNDAESAEMLTRTNRAIERAVTDLISQANQLIKWGQLNDAQAALDQARDLDPGASGLERAGKRLLEAERASATGKSPTSVDSAAAATSNADVDRPLTDAEQREASRLYQQAIAALSKNQSEEAIRYLELVWNIDPTYERVSDHLKREYLTRGMEYFADGALDDAVKMWEAALRVDPNDQRAKGYLSRAKKQATRTREILGGSR